MRLSLFTVVLFSLTPAVAAAQVPEKYEPVLGKGLTWLAKQQAPDGSWSVQPPAALSAQPSAFPTAMTALAGMAFLAEGSTPSAGNYQETLRRAVDWLVDSCQTSGRYDGRFGREDPSETPRYMFGQGYAVLFLASAYPEEKGARRRARMRDALNRGVRFIARAQGEKGGWFYTAAFESKGQDEGATTIANLQGLRAARLAGIPLPANVLERSQAYLKTNTGSVGGVYYSSSTRNERPALTAAAIASFDVEELKDPVARKWIEFRQRSPLPLGGRADDTYHIYYTALAAYRLGDDGKLLGKPGTPHWSETRDKLFAHLSKTQLPDGSWNSSGSGGSIGPAFATSLYLAVLQLDRETIPAFLR